MARNTILIAILTAGAWAQGCADDPTSETPLAPSAASENVHSEAVIVTADGDITSAVNAFRALLGEPLNGVAPGEQPTGRREINWDAVPAQFTNVNDFPGNFFIGRGALFTTPGTGQRVSDNDFADINPTYGGEFQFFSPVKTFAAIGSEELDVLFQVAGSSTPALVTGFGVVLSDVDRAGSAKLRFFDADGRNLGVIRAPVRVDDAGLSFVGAVWPSPVVARVRITTGHGALDADVDDIDDGGTRDLVVMDDFLYGEPHAIP